MATEQPAIVDAAAVLDRAAALVRRGWTRGWYARDKANTEVGAHEDTACKWCVIGAISRARTELGATPEVTDECIARLRAMLNTGPLGTWNDGQHTRRPVVAALERAARLARGNDDTTGNEQ